MGRLLFLAALTLGLLVAACSERVEETGTEETPATADTGPGGPPLPPDVNGGEPGSVIRPPGASLVTSAGSFEGGAGTYCWREDNRGLCLDFVGPISNVEPIAVAGDELLAIEYAAGTPSSVDVAWYAVGDSRREPTADGGLAWVDHPPAFREPVSRGSLRAPSGPGEYLLTAFAVFAGRGDVFYSFFVVVE